MQVTVKYDPSEAVKQRENLGLLVTKLRGDQQLLSVPSVFDAFMQLPSPKQSTEVQSERTEELVVEEITDVMTEEEREQMKDKQREEFEQKKLSWD